jgi:GT2 family glycosyltransferase
MPEPAVSILLAVLNGERYLQETLDALSAQTFGDFEIVAVDNGSTDRTPEILAAHAARDPRLRIDRFEERGVSAAVNRAHALSRAPLVARMDGDDVAAPTLLERQVAVMAREPDLVLLGVWAMLIDAEGREIGPQRQVAAHDAIVEQFTKGQCPITTPGAIMRRWAVDRAGGYRRAFLSAEDYDLWYRLSEIGRVANIPEILVRYRLHNDGNSRQITMASFDRATVARLCGLARRRGVPEPLRGDTIDLPAALAIAGTTLEDHRWRQVEGQLRRGVATESPVVAERLFQAASEAARELRSPLRKLRARLKVANARRRRAAKNLSARQRGEVPAC